MPHMPHAVHVILSATFGDAALFFVNLRNESHVMKRPWVTVRYETFSTTHMPQRYNMQTQDYRRLLEGRINTRGIVNQATMVIVLRMARSDHCKGSLFTSRQYYISQAAAALHTWPTKTILCKTACSVFMAPFCTE